MSCWYRSWPSWWDPDKPWNNAPRHLRERPYIIDGLSRIYMKDWDYNQTFDGWPNRDLFLLEWDVALDRQGRETFEHFALAYPEMISVARYHLSDDRSIYGMGCIYLPYAVVTAFKEYGARAYPGFIWSDSSLFKWYAEEPRLCDSVYPQHLNS